MEIASGKWLSELEMVVDSMCFPQYQIMNHMDYSVDDLHFQSSLSSESYSSYQIIDQNISPALNSMNDSCIQVPHHEVEDFKRPLKQLKTNKWNSFVTENNNNIPPPMASYSSSSHIISFDNPNISSPAISQQYHGLDCYVKPTKEVSDRAGSPLQAQDHVIAERKRREKLSHRFISLSKLIPGLKKTDKASILGEAARYVKQLQVRVTLLEEQVAKKTSMESVISVKKTKIYADDETSSSDENFNSHSNKPLHEIEARVSDKDVLIRIHSEKNKGCISNIINEVENLHLSVLNSNVLPFGHGLYIIIAAQMEAEFSMTVKDLVKSLYEGLCSSSFDL